MKLSVTIDENGISAPDFAAVLAELQARYKAIYGNDIALDPSTQDAQLLAIFSSVVNDVNQSAVDAFNAYRPGYAQGAGLSTIVKINGISRRVPTHSTAPVVITGVAGTTIAGGKVAQASTGQTWSLPPTVIVEPDGDITVTATCDIQGAVTAAAGDLTQIATPSRGWQAVTNPDPADAGAPVETDAQLRRRQAASVALPALSPLEAIKAALGQVAGVSRSTAYENDTDAVDANGIPAHSIAAVVSGGVAADIGTAIRLKKGPGIQTYGTTAVTVYDSRGVPSVINYYNLSVQQLKFEVTVKALPGYTAAVADLIKAALASETSGALGSVNRLEIGEDSYLNRLFAPANLMGSAAVEATGKTQAELAALAETFTVTLIRQAKLAGAFAAADVVIAFNEAAAAQIVNVTVIVV